MPLSRISPLRGRQQMSINAVVAKTVHQRTMVFAETRKNFMDATAESFMAGPEVAGK